MNDRSDDWKSFSEAPKTNGIEVLAFNGSVLRVVMLCDGEWFDFSSRKFDFTYWMKIPAVVGIEEEK